MRRLAGLGAPTYIAMHIIRQKGWRHLVAELRLYIVQWPVYLMLIQIGCNYCCVFLSRITNKMCMNSNVIE